MNRLFLCTALIIVSLNGSLMAQGLTYPWVEKNPRSKTETAFNMPACIVNVRDFVHLNDEQKIIFELNNPNDYEYIRNLDSTINQFIQDITFYKDSLANNLGNVRIDYARTQEAISQLSFKKYNPGADMFIKRNGALAKMKLEQDTIRFFLRVFSEERNGKKGFKNSIANYHMVQITFCLNNYSNIEKIAANKYLLRNIIDTLLITKRESTKSDPYKFPSSAIYKPFSETKRFEGFGGIIETEARKSWRIANRSDYLTFDGNMGIGLVRNTLTPNAEMGITYMNRQRKLDKNDYLFGRLTMSTYLFFDKNAAGEYLVHDNWFVNAELGEKHENETNTMGIGYLAFQKGNYFKGTTLKVFLNLRLKKSSFTISPEIIITNDFKQIFPGITLKVF